MKDDLRFQKVTWTVERVGWLIMAVIVVAAAAGAFGGPTAREDARDVSGRVQVSYHHFQRHLYPTEFGITVDPRGRSAVIVRIDRSIAEAFEIRTIVPAPADSMLDADGLRLRFTVAAATRAPPQIKIMAVPTGPGRIRGGIGLLGEEPARLSILIYP